MNMIHVWNTNWGPLFLPDDFPFAALRKDGWYDRRRKLTGKVREYIEWHEARLAEHICKDGADAKYAYLPSFEAWLKS